LLLQPPLMSSMDQAQMFQKVNQLLLLQVVPPVPEMVIVPMMLKYVEATSSPMLLQRIFAFRANTVHPLVEKVVSHGHSNVGKMPLKV